MERRYIALIALTLSFANTLPASAADFVDPLDLASLATPKAARTPLQAIARVDGALVSVGQRGHIVMSTDGGKTWAQSAVPVSSDLTAVQFVDAKNGWAVGHDGVVLRTKDAGRSWTLQLDGRRANDLLLTYMQQVSDADSASADKKRLLQEAKRFHAQGPDKPFLDLWFSDASTGFVVGAFNMIFRTTDGGLSWRPWFDRTDNPKLFNLYAVRPAAGGIYIAAEGGLVLRLDPGSDRFVAQAVPYQGSFFGVVGDQDYVLVYGLRGNAYRSDDRGRSWTKAEPGLFASIVGGATTRDGTLLLADVGGRVAASRDAGRSFGKATLIESMPLTGLTESIDGNLAICGAGGVLVTAWAAR